MTPWRAAFWIIALGAAFVLVVLFGPHAAQARWRGRCPHGEILRVSMGHCVSIHSSLAAPYVHRDYVRLSPAPRHHRLRHGRCNPRTMCGDDHPEDEVVGPPTPQTSTPRDIVPDSAVPQLPPRSELPDAFTRSTMRFHPHLQWRVQ